MELARADRAYRDWKRAIDELWADKHHRLCLVEEQAACARQEEAARHQQLLNEQAARACQEAAHACQEEAAHRQQLLNEQAARACQEAACTHQEEAAAHACQEEAAARARQEEAAAHAHQEEAAHRQRAAEARKTAAAQLIFLWLRRRRLYARLACQTSRRQQRKATLAHQLQKNKCCARALQAEKQRSMQVAAVQAKAHTDEAKE